MFRVRKSKLHALAAAAALAAPAISMGQVSATWTFTGTAAGFGTAGQWLGGLPGAGGTASFRGNPGPSGAANITFSAATTLGGLYFQAYAGTNYYSITQNPGAAVQTLTFNNATGNTVDVANGNATLSIPVVAPNFIKTGAGTLILTGTNTFSSGVTVDGGLLRIMTSTALNGPLIVGTGNAGVLELNGGTTALITIGSPAAPGGSVINTSGALRATGINGLGVVVVQTGTMTVNGGTISVNGSIVDGSDNTTNGFNKAGTGLMTARSAVLNGSLNVRGGTLAMARQVTANTASGTSRVKGLTIAGGATPTATLDLTNNVMIVDSADFATSQATFNRIVAQVAFANDSYAWDQPGITSTKAADDLNNFGIPTTIGILWNNDGADGNIGFYGNALGDANPNDFPLFRGNAVDQETVLMMYTYIGDANLDGVVDGNDFSLLQLGLGNSAPYSSWEFGDFNYDGFYDGNDFSLFQLGLGFGGPQLGDPLIMQLAAFADANGFALIPSIAALVPEPSTLGILGLAGVGLLKRRRR